MEGMERIHELLEQLMEEGKKLFPKATDFDFRMQTDGYMAISIGATDRDPEIPLEAWKRCVFLDQFKPAGRDYWTEDTSKFLNEYYEDRNLLLKEG